jgi:hypothetical protein
VTLGNILEFYHSFREISASIFRVEESSESGKTRCLYRDKEGVDRDSDRAKMK